MGEPAPVLYVQMDGTGVPVVKKETEGRKGKMDGQPAHTREAKLGCVFTQTAWDQEGFPIRDPDSTTYTAAIEAAEEFGKRPMWRLGSVAGAAPRRRSLGGRGRVDLEPGRATFSWCGPDRRSYHARQHLWELARKLYPNDEVNQKTWIRVHQKRLLDKGKIEKLAAALRAIHSTNPEVAEKIRTEADYFQTNTERMRYPKFRCQHLFVGSGVIEAGCKTVIGSRLKQSGMFWTVRGANAILALRAVTSTAALRTIGRHAELPNPHFHVANPVFECRMSLKGEFVSNSG
jgi:hypothetical protein